MWYRHTICKCSSRPIMFLFCQFYLCMLMHISTHKLTLTTNPHYISHGTHTHTHTHTHTRTLTIWAHHHRYTTSSGTFRILIRHCRQAPSPGTLHPSSLLQRRSLSLPPSLALSLSRSLSLSLALSLSVSLKHTHTICGRLHPSSLLQRRALSPSLAP